MSELNASNLRKEHGNEGPDLVGVTELTSPYFMVPPSGTTAERPQNPQKGTLRFNTDIGSLEYFRGDTIGWEQIQRTTPNLGGGTGSNTGTGARGCLAGGNAPAFKNEIEFLHTMITATQEKAVPSPGKQAMLYFDGVILSHCNEAEWNKFKSEHTNEAILDRIVRVNVPYCL